MHVYMGIHQARKTWPDSLGSLESKQRPGRGRMHRYGWNDTSPPTAPPEPLEHSMQVNLGLEPNPGLDFRKNGPESAKIILIKKKIGKNMNWAGSGPKALWASELNLSIGLNPAQWR